MICPKCRQQNRPAPDGRCPFCSFDQGPFSLQLKKLYLLTTAFFVSTLIYAGMVYIFDTQHLASSNQASQRFIPYVLLVLAVLIFGIAVRIGQRLFSAPSMNQLQRLFIIKLALVEAIAVYGLLSYFLFASIQWFVTFLAISLLGLMQTAGQMPAVAARLADLAVRESEQQPAASQSPQQ